MQLVEAGFTVKLYAWMLSQVTPLVYWLDKALGGLARNTSDRDIFKAG